MSEAKHINIMVLGLRGFPNVQGGVESHCQELYPRLIEKGFSVDVITRAPYVDRSIKEWKGVRFRALWSPASSSLEAMLHSLIGVLYAAVKRPDVLHIHAIGPGIVTPIARLLGLRVVVTHHGPDYDREKWGKFARFILKLGEAMGMRFSSRRIVISNVIRALVMDKYTKDSDLIPNGVSPAGAPGTGKVLSECGLEAGKYVALVSRMVPEKRHINLIKAFRQAALGEWKLALIGDLSAEDVYVGKVRAEVGESSDVVLTGFRSGEQLRDLLTNAGVFVLPSSHEGLPIALLEAMSYGLPVIASDIPAHLELDLDKRCYFPLGDEGQLSDRLKLFEQDDEFRRSQSVIGKKLVAEKYDWDDVASRTADVYCKAVSGAQYELRSLG